MRRIAACLALGSCSQEYDVTSRVDVDPEAVTECDFEAVDGAPGFSAYSCNPVFTASDESWAARLGSTTFLETSVVQHPFYQIWYVGLPEDGEEHDFQVGTAISEDGTEWLAHDDNPGWSKPDRDEWDGNDIQRIKVAWDDRAQSYRMAYGGISRDFFFGIGTAASADGVSWQRDPLNPAISMGAALAGITYAWPVAYTIDDGQHSGLFAGRDEIDGPYHLYQLTADDPILWPMAEPRRLLRAGESGAFDDEGFLDAALVHHDGVDWLFYIGFGRWVDQGAFRYTADMFMGAARKVEGGDWERISEEPIPLHNQESGGIQSIAARSVGTRIHLWLTDDYEELDTSAIGYFIFEPEEWP